MSNSWYVEFLLRNREFIKNKIYTQIPDMSEPAYVLDLEDDMYNDLLLVEGVIKDMWSSGRMTRKQIDIVKLISQGFNLTEIEERTGVSRTFSSKIFTEFCNTVAFILGGTFSDEGYIDYMREKYGLNNEQLEKLKKFLESNKRHSIGGYIEH
jgi:hypothetical protein